MKKCFNYSFKKEKNLALPKLNLPKASKTIDFSRKTTKIKLRNKLNKLANLLLFEYICILSINSAISNNYINIKVNQEGLNQILSDICNKNMPTVTVNG